jgi:DNA-binding transcriptional MerR regulator
MPKKFLRTADLAKATGISVQTVRNYEERGFLPAAARSPTGYRLYTSRHLYALRVAQMLVPSFGWWHSRNILAHIHQDDLNVALATIDARHGELHHERQATEETLRLLRETSATLPRLLDDKQRYRDGVPISEAAKIAGVRTSALRFWEELGLLQPRRDKNSHYRLYDAEQLRRLQVVALLRKGNYRFEAIRTVLDQIAQGSLEEAFAAAEKRLQELAVISRRCVEATAALWAYVESLETE